jgi:hypothetical protein
MARQDQSHVTLIVDGRQIGIVFSKRGGGTADSEEAKYPPGSMGPERALGGRQTVENVTLNGEFRPDRDQAEIDYLKARVGGGEAKVAEQALDAAGHAFGKPELWSGVLKAVDTGDYDASANEAREFELEISTHGITG